MRHGTGHGTEAMGSGAHGQQPLPHPCTPMQVAFIWRRTRAASPACTPSIRSPTACARAHTHTHPPPRTCTPYQGRYGQRGITLEANDPAVALAPAIPAHPQATGGCTGLGGTRAPGGRQGRWTRGWHHQQVVCSAPYVVPDDVGGGLALDSGGHLPKSSTQQGLCGGHRGLRACLQPRSLYPPESFRTLPYPSRTIPSHPHKHPFSTHHSSP